jgi:hypothetical protein
MIQEFILFFLFLFVSKACKIAHMFRTWMRNICFVGILTRKVPLRNQTHFEVNLLLELSDLNTNYSG